MKTVLLIFILLITTQSSYGSDSFVDEVDCSKVKQDGEADNGLDIVIQTNQTASVKRAVIFENGYLGRQEIGHFQLPVDQPDVSTPSFFNSTRVATYQADGLLLTMTVTGSKGERILGPAQAHIELPGYEPLDVELTCSRSP